MTNTKNTPRTWRILGLVIGLALGLAFGIARDELVQGAGLAIALGYAFWSVLAPRETETTKAD